MMGNVRTINRPQDQFVMVPNDFARDAEIPPSAFRVAVYIMSHATSWEVSQESIGRALGMNPGTVAKALKDLTLLGYAFRQPQHDRTGRKPDLITVSCERLTKDQWCSVLEIPCQSPTRLSPTGESPTGESREPKKSINSKKTKDQEDQKDSSSSDDEGLFAAPEVDRPESKTGNVAFDAEFEIWWKSVPRKIGKGQALRAWRTARRGGVSVDTLTDGMERAAAFWAAERTAPQYVPHPSTWLNGKRWEDDLLASTASPARRSMPGPGVVHTAQEREEQREWFAAQPKSEPASPELLREIMGDLYKAEEPRELA